MNISTVNELIQSLESAGELSIKETKVMELAKAYLDVAAENVAAKKIISECREYFIAGVMNRIRPTNEGYLHMICDTFADETPATDAYLAGIKADGVEAFAAYCGEENSVFVEAQAYYRSLPDAAAEFCTMLREGADK